MTPTTFRASFLSRYPVFAPFALLFVWVNFVSTQEGGFNAMSRMVTLHAMAEHSSLRIDEYQQYTSDWTQSRHDRHYYQNKAPGPVFWGFPVYWPLHRISALAAGTGPGAAPLPGYFHKTALSFGLQVFPFLLLAFLLLRGPLSGSEAPLQALFLGSLLFGSTAAVLMNSYFGHGLAAIFLLASFLFLWRRRFPPAAFFFANAAFSDYAVCVLAPLYLLFLPGGAGWKTRLGQTALGAAPVAGIWAWYHSAHFGSPWSLPMAHLSPAFKESTAAVKLGVFGLLPNPDFVRGLLWGPERGLLFTQPWILLMSVLSPWFLKGADRWDRRLALFCVLGFWLLFYLNASFEGWHGGGSPGPRYMCVIFPLFSWLLAIQWKGWPRWLRTLITVALLYTFVFRLALAPGSILIDSDQPLWPYLWEGLRDQRRGSERIKLLAILVVGLLCAAWAVRMHRAAGASPDAGHGGRNG